MPECQNCGQVVTSVDRDLVETRDGRWICWSCVRILNMCEICGSIRMVGQSIDDQLHYDELCFK